MKYKVVIDPGHGGKDNGAVKYLVEDTANLQQALACRDFLQLYDCFELWLSRTADTETDLNKTCNKCNSWGADIALSFHNNAGGGDGFEVWHAVGSSNGIKLGRCIEKHVKAMGQQSRGLKTRKNAKGLDYFGFNRIPRCPSVILEGCFVDNKKDAAGFDTEAENRAYGYAVAKGVLDYFGVKKGTVYMLTCDMNHRAARSLNSDVLGVVKAGTLVTGTLLLDGWLKCEIKGKTGYIRVKGKKDYGKKL